MKRVLFSSIAILFSSQLFASEDLNSVLLYELEQESRNQMPLVIPSEPGDFYPSSRGQVGSPSGTGLHSSGEPVHIDALGEHRRLSAHTEKSRQLVTEHLSARGEMDALRLRRERAELEAAIAKANAECRAAGGCSHTAPPIIQNMPQQSLDSSAMSFSSNSDFVSVPGLESVIGDKALFVTSKGKLYANVGATLPGGFLVARIDLKEVVLRMDDQEYRVALKWDPRQDTPTSTLSATPPDEFMPF